MKFFVRAESSVYLSKRLKKKLHDHILFFGVWFKKIRFTFTIFRVCRLWYSKGYVVEFMKLRKRVVDAKELRG